MAITVISQSGPLPITKSFNAPSDAEMLLFVSGSVYSSTENSWTSVEVLLDGVVLGGLWLFCNFANSHQAMVPTMLPITTTFGEHTITLQVNSSYSNTISDGNDIYNVTLMY